MIVVFLFTQNKIVEGMGDGIAVFTHLKKSMSGSMGVHYSTQNLLSRVQTKAVISSRVWTQKLLPADCGHQRLPAKSGRKQLPAEFIFTQFPSRVWISSSRNLCPGKTEYNMEYLGRQIGKSIHQPRHHWLISSIDSKAKCLQPKEMTF
jgi:hypothetical protein